MKRWFSVSVLFVVAYAVALGFFSWKTFVVHTRPDYRPLVRWNVPWISPPAHGDPHQAYFRKSIYIQSRPRAAWVVVIAPDRFVFLVNGAKVGGPTYRSGYAEGVFDIAQHLKAGTNVLAIRNDIFTYHQTPRIAVQGRYIQWNGVEGEFRSDASWRTAWRSESLTSQGGIVKPTPWFGPEFDDGQWGFAIEGDAPRETVAQRFLASPILVTEPVRGPWIWADAPDAPEAFFRLAFELDERPRDAWIRIMAKRHDRLMVNGYFVATHEQTIGTDAALPGPVRAYNINPFLRRGRNVVAVQASNTWNDRGLLVDGWVEKREGERQWLLSGGWKASTGGPRGWEEPGFDDRDWQPAVAVKPLTPVDQPALVTQLGVLKRPLSFQLLLFAQLVLHVAGALVLSGALWAGSARALGALSATPAHAVARWLPLIYVPPTALLVAIYLLGFDARLSLAFPYQVRFMGASLVLLCALQVALMTAAVFKRRGGRVRVVAPWARWWERRGRIRAVDPAVVMLIALVIVGFALRFKDLDYEPLGGDETSAALFSQGVLERGYPSLAVAGSPKVALTSGLTFYVKSLLLGLLGPSAFSQRLTDVFFGTAVIVLLYLAGRLFHSKRAGLFAAAVYTFLPSTIGMTHYARYPSQQQFFCLLTTMLLYRALREGRVRPRALYLGAAAYIATYLSWEGAIFFLPSVTLGVMVLTRPNFGWLKSKHIWVAVGLTGWLIFCQLAYRLYEQTQRAVYGTGARDAGIKFMWLYPFYDPYTYIVNFFLLENHHILTLIFVLGLPLWFSRSPEGRMLGYLATTLICHLALVTNFLELSHWRYVYLLFPLLVLSASVTLVIFLDHLGGLARSAQAAPAVARWVRHGTVAAVVSGVLVFSTTFVVQLYHLPYSYASLKTRLWMWSYPSMLAARDYIRAFRLPGDIVIAVNPHVFRFLEEPADYFVQSELRLSLTLASNGNGEVTTLSPLHRLTGVPTIFSADQMREVLARGHRIWLVSYEPPLLAVTKDLTKLIQANMSIVYEDFSTTVYLFGDRTPVNGQDGRERVGWAVKEP